MIAKLAYAYINICDIYEFHFEFCSLTRRIDKLATDTKEGSDLAPNAKYQVLVSQHDYYY